MITLEMSRKQNPVVPKELIRRYSPLHLIKSLEALKAVTFLMGDFASWCHSPAYSTNMIYLY
jgi:hypothetical protein